ncbi:importin beta-3 subunit, putative [Entamoeba invadens IP1]|uniref:Importin beta-3 subunit, putative n=1 Tax=Entamoeba invadens IP1 TaxID=370355 RepID=A0A0A1U151_ENTIV|nr:importin beta-3 subunit, putative [Entamoeba invadens IP1]ELP87758.1 importin beta-3 subunit, putative [Entamoeba invadens IP1]|eukprot:XP_004254529.1 importin beta-3 subunit, putative [Entamoeba invadens IP1]
MADLTAILQASMSPDNETRKKADVLVEQLKQNPSVFLPQVLTYSNAESKNPPNLRVIALTIVNNMLVKIPQLRAVIPDQLLLEMCNAIAINCKVENDLHLVPLLSTVVTTFALAIQQENLPWPNYIQFLFALTQEQNIIQQCIALDALGKSTIHPESQLILSHVSELKTYLARCLSIDSLPLRLKAITFISNTAVFLEKTAEGKKFYELYPLIAQTMQSLLANNNFEEVNNILEDLQELTQFSQFFFKPILPAVSENLLQICTSNYDGMVKSGAMEVILVLIEAYPASFKKTDYLQKVLVILLNWLASVTDADVQDWLDEDTGDTLFEYAQDAIETLTGTVGGKPLRDTLFAQCLEFIKRNDWPHRFAALSAFSQVVPRGKFVIKSNITELLQLGFAATQDDQPLVVYAFLDLIEELLDTFPHIMIRMHFDVIVKALTLCVKSKYKRVQERACFSLQSLLENLEDSKQKIIPALPTLVESMLVLLGSNSDFSLKSSALTSLVFITLLATPQMATYYQSFQTVFAAILPTCKDYHSSETKGKIIEMMSIFNSKLNPQFFPNIQDILYTTLLELFKQPIGIEDPLLPYAMSALCRLVDSPTKAIHPNLEKFMTIVFERIALPITLDNKDQTNVINVTNVITSEKKFLLLSVKKIADYLKGSYAVFAEKTFAIVSPFLQSNNSVIKITACEVLPVVVSSLVAAMGKTDQVKQLYYRVVNILCQVLVAERISDNIEVVLDCLNYVISAVGENSLDAQMIGILFESFDKLLFGCLEGNTEVQQISEKMNKDEDELDDEEAEMLNDQANFDTWLQKMLQVLGTVCENHVQTFFAAFNMKLFPRIMIYFNQEDNEMRCSFAVSAMGTVISKGKLYHYIPHVGDKFVEYMKSSMSDVAFNAILFVGVFAELEIPEFQNLVPKVLNVISELVSRKKNKAYFELHSQIVTTLGLIVLHNKTLPNRDALVKSFIGLFPVSEGYSKLVEVIFDMQNQNLITSNNENETAEIIYRLVSFCAGAVEEEVCSKDTKKKILLLLKKWTTEVPQNIIQAVWNKLTVEQKGELSDLQNEQL